MSQSAQFGAAEAGGIEYGSAVSVNLVTQIERTIEWRETTDREIEF